MQTIVSASLEGPHVDGLQTLGALLDAKFNLLLFAQCAEPIPLDSRVMDEYVLSSRARDEAKSLGIVEPFDGSSFSFSHFTYSFIQLQMLGEAAQTKQKRDHPVSASLGSPRYTAKTYFVLRATLYHSYAEQQATEMALD
jgi:hypothetical protein